MSARVIEDQASLEVGKPTSKKRFSTKDPIIDQLYQTVDQLVFELERDSHSSYEAIEGGHRITYGNFCRFTKMEGERHIACEMRSGSDAWMAVPVGQRALEDRYSLTPIMWPLKNSSLGNLNRSHFMTQVNGVWEKHLQELYANNPDFKNDPEKIRKILQAGLVLRKKWLNSYTRFRQMSHRHCVKQWWKHFVDRDLFKMWVSISGTRNDSNLSWKEYAMLSSHPLLPQIEANVSGLGKERSMLLFHPYNKWPSLQTKDLLPKEWVVVWNDVRHAPKCVQDMLLKGIESAHVGFAVDGNTHIASSCFVDEIRSDFSFTKNTKDQSQSLFMGKNGRPRIWEMFQQLIQQNPSLSPREQEMVLFACAHSATLRGYPSVVPVLEKAVPQFIKVWKEVHPEDFKKWSYTSRQGWIETIGTVLNKSFEDNEYSIPVVKYTSRFEKYTLIKNQNEMLDAVQDSAGVKKAAKRRRM